MTFCHRKRSLRRRERSGELALTMGTTPTNNDYIRNDGENSNDGSDNSDGSDDQFSDEVFN
jgi:hypothetical protein